MSRPTNSADLELLGIVIAALQEVTGDEETDHLRIVPALDAFVDMEQRLRGRGDLTLSPKQRAWVMSIAEKVDAQIVGPTADEVPRGREVALAVDGMPRPAKPPGRRA